MISGVPETLRVVVHDLITKILETNKCESFSSDAVKQLYSFGENLFTCSTKPALLPEVEGQLFSILQANGRDIDSLKLKRLLRTLHNLPSVRRKAEILEFFYQLSSHNYSRRKADIPSVSDSLFRNTNPTNNGSSGFVSDLLSHSSLQPKSKPPTPAVRSTIRSGDSSSSAADHLVNLWGPSVCDSNRSLSGNNLSHRFLSHRIKNPPLPKAASRTTVSEAELLRELVFVLNGVGGNLIKFDHLQDSFRLVPTANVPVGQQDSIHRIAECGWLHNKIKQFINLARNDRSSGTVLQSFASGLHEHLTEYYRLVATLESQLNQDKHEFSGDHTSQSDHTTDYARSTETISNFAHSGVLDFHIDRAGDNSTVYSRDHQPTISSSLSVQPLTITRLVLWTQEPRLRLRFLASLCDVCRDLKGGALASEVFSYTLHGDPEVALIMRHLMLNVASSLLHFISQWIYDGHLDDPYQEFFVESDMSVKMDRLWYDKYNLRHNMIPRFITSTQANKILVTGKSINFLIHVCGEKQGIKNRESIRHTRLKKVESMFEQDLDRTFDQMISTVYKQTSQHLLETLIGRYHFLDHLRATRQFLLLGQGDFIQHLMDLLDRLSSILETAIRDTNAQYEQPEILQRLDVRLLDISTAQDTGWDIFSLDYHVDGPLATIFTDNCRFMYLFSFNFLWRAKRMEFTLSNLWKQQLCATRLGHDLQIDLALVLHLLQLFGAEIRHFVQQLQYYINFEVLECAWENLVKHVHSAQDLGDVIKAHQAFLSNVFTRCLLDAESRQLLGQLRAIFNSILDYAQLHQDFNTTAMNENSRREKYASDVQRTTQTGLWGTDRLQEEQESIRRKEFVDSKLAHLQARIRIQAAAYRANLIKFIEMLSNHADPSLRLLAEHMNFNGHYTTSSHGSSYTTSGSITSGYPSLNQPKEQIQPSEPQHAPTPPTQEQQPQTKNPLNNIIILKSALPYSGSVTPSSSLTVGSRQTESGVSHLSNVSSRKNSSASDECREVAIRSKQ
ncbi:Gamma-tubulin complex component 3 [Schistosoma japonicum]|nr:Gamma-tubulin complex component 3 [Schistosoma japonicum]